jgi:hypothetical protein
MWLWVKRNLIQNTGHWILNRLEVENEYLGANNYLYVVVISSNNIDVKMKNKYLKQIQKLLKSYHKKWDCFGNIKNEKKNKTR